MSRDRDSQRESAISPVSFQMLPEAGRPPAERGAQALARLDQSSCLLGSTASWRASSTEWGGEEIMGTAPPQGEPAFQATSLPQRALLGPHRLSSSPSHAPSLGLVRVRGPCCTGAPPQPPHSTAPRFRLQPLDSQGILTSFQL